jgi:3-deoxy-D-manno-octulosonate 8-phosphate phosphatase (KDO 8-P phosphatase)
MRVVSELEPERLCAVRLIAMDVDGVLTDGAIIWSPTGSGVECNEIKIFDVKDGFAVKWASKLGLTTAIVTGRLSPAVQQRARELGVTFLVTGCANKREGLAHVCHQAELPPESVAYIGDDLPDLGALKLAGLGIAVADAVPEVKDAADAVTVAQGGRGAVREAVEAILRGQGLWEHVVAQCESPGESV